MRKIFTLIFFLLLLIALFNGTLQAQSATALKFDPSLAINDNSRLNYVGIDNPFTAYQKEITVEFWMNPATANLPFGSVMGQSTNNDGTNTVWLMHPNSNGTITFFVNDGGTLRGVTVNIIAGSWHHYAGVANATSTKFYVDGVLMNTGPGISGTIVSNPASVIHIGKDVRFATRFVTNNDPFNRYATMTMDEVRVWSRALCVQEISNNKNCELFNPTSQNKLEGYYNFNQGIAGGNNTAVTTLNDLSGNNRNGTLYNFSLNGPNSNWVTSGSVNTGTCAPFVAPTAPITGTTSICMGTSTTLSNANSGGVWSSSNTGVATINASSGLVNSVAAGTTVITYRTECDGVSTQTLTVGDNIAPVITCPSNKTLASCETIIPDYKTSIIVSDNCTATPGLIISQSPAAGTAIASGATVTVTITAKDASNNTASCSFTVTRPDITPVANADAAVVCPGSSVNVNVLGNDSHPQGLSLTVSDNTVPSVGTLVKNANNTFTYTAPANYSGPVTFTYTIKANDGVIPFSGNNHYYEFVSASGITWANAKIAAAARTYNGLQGYLVTVTSAGEQAFAATKLTGAGWMGSSDLAYEGVWRWVTGPEGLEDGGQGRIFSNQLKGGGNCAASTGQGMNGNYVNWNPGEPNDCGANLNQYSPTDPNRGGEHFGHFYVGSGLWNDFPNNATVEGYVVEYGGLENCTPVLTATATVTITVNQLPAATVSKSDVQCSGGSNGSITINASGGTPPYQYSKDGGSTYQSASNVFTGLTAGNYAIYIKDANGCPKSLGSVTISQADNTPPAITCVNAITVNNDPGKCGAYVDLTTRIVGYDPTGGNTSATPVTATYLAPGISAGSLSQVGFESWGSNPGVWPVGRITSSPGFSSGTYLTFTATLSQSRKLANITYSKLSYVGNGATFASVRSSLDGFAADISTISVNPSGYQLLRFDLTSLPLVTGAITFRIYFWGATANLQDWDDLVSSARAGYNATGLTLNAINTATATDNCSGVNLSYSNIPAGLQFPVGTTIVTTNATDASGNSSSCNLSVTVIDNTPPVINCQANISAPASSVAGAVINYATPAATDNCSGVSVTRIAGSASGSTFPIGTTTVTYKATDGAGLTAQCSFTVTVTVAAPVIHCPSNITVGNAPGQCGANVSFAATETTGIPASTITYSQAPGSFFPVGTTTVTATATNAAGSSSCSFTVTVTAADTDGDGVPDACDDDADNDGIPNALECNKSNFFWSNPPTISANTATGTINGIAYTYTSSLPVSTTTGVYNHAAFPVLYGVPNANPTIQNLAVTNNTINFASPMTNPVLVFASIGNSGSPVPIEFGAPVQVVWSQAVDQDSPTRITGKEGYAIVRMMGTFSSISFNYLVAENYCNFAFGADFQTCGDTDNDGIPDYLDTDSDGDGCPDAIEGSMSFSISQTSGGRLIGGVNSHGIPLLAGNGQGTGTSQNYVANCFCQPGLDETPPTVITKNITVNLDAGGNAAITPAQVNNGSTDACGAVSLAVSKTNFNCSNIGANTVTLTVTDNQGNMSTGTATVTVVDNIPPVISCPVNITTNATSIAGAVVTYVTPVGTDNCSSITTRTAGPASGSTFPIGVTTVTHTVTDASGNTAQCSFTVTVVAVAPVIHCPSDISLSNTPGQCGANVTFAATETTAIPASTIVYSHASGSFFPVGATTVTATATNAVGTSVCTFVVTVTDTQLPTVLAQNVTVYLDHNGQASITAAQVNNGSSDNCGIATMTVSPANFTCADLPAPVTVNTQTIISDNTWKESTTSQPNPNFCITNFWGGVSGPLPSLASYTVTPTINAYSVTLIPGTQGIFGLNDVRFYRKTFNLTSLAGIKATLLASMDNGAQIFINGVPVAITNTMDGANFNGAIPNRVILNSTGANVNGGVGYHSFNSITGANASDLFVLGTNEIVLALANCNGNDRGAVTFKAIIENNVGGPGSVVLTVTDVNGNSASANAVVTVVDTINPVITCQADINTYATSAAGAVVNYTTPVGTDNCTAVTVRTTGLASGSTFPIGTTTVTHTVTDASGLTASCSFNVIISGLAPAIHCPANITVNATAAQCGTTVPFAATETTAIPASTISYTENGNPVTPGSFFTVGTHTILATAVNAVGTSTCSFTITVVDDQFPVLTGVPADITVECDAVPSAATVTATDNCSTSVPAFTETRTNGNCTGRYTLTRTWSTTDASGNNTTATQLITVQDTQVPVLSDAPADVTVECNAVPAAAILTATDNCSTPVVTYNEVRTDGDCPNRYTLTRTWTATDACGNTSSKTQVITVQDTQVPVLSDAPADVTVECNAVPVAATLTATDNCSAPVVTYNEVRTDGDCPNRYTLTRTWTATDACGNTSSKTQVITVQDTQVPVLSDAPENVTVECNAVPAAAILTATDNCSTPVVAYSEVRTDGDCPNRYTLTRTWTATDACGNTSSKTQVITVQDTQVPVLSDAPADVTVECNAVPVAAILTATDNCSTPVVTYSEARTDGDCPNRYTLTRTWTATDACGNTSSKTQVITVQDTQVPVLSDAPENVTVECNAVPAAAVLTATDNCSTPVVTYSEARTDGDCPNRYTLTRTWTATDACGNTSSKTQLITVQDTQVPVLSDAPADVTVECNAVPVAAILTATDNCSTPVVTYNEVRTNGSSPYNYTLTRTWTATDACGNTSSKTQVITVQDTQAPVPTIAALQTLTGDCSVTATVPTAMDNCAGLITATTLDPTSYTAQGVYTITWNYDDGNGNTSTQTQIIIVKDVSGPIPTLSILPTITGQCSVAVTGKPTATDACSGVTAQGTTTDPLTYTVQGTYTIHWTYTDYLGNKTYQNQTVIVADNIAPVPNVVSLPVIEGQCSVNITMVNSTRCTDNCFCCRSVCHCRSNDCNCRGWSEWIYNILSYFLGGAFDNNHGCDHDDDVDDVNNMKMQAPTATDNCKGTIIGTTTDPLTYSTQGTYIIHWSFTDGNGNTTIQEQTVIVKDVEAPVPNAHNLSTIYATCSVTVTNKPTAKDNCKGTITATTTDPLSYTGDGTYVIHWTYNDGNGNITTQNQTVIINDDTRPVINEPNDITISCGSSTLPATTGNATATDNCSGVTITYTDVVNGNKITRTWKATDAAGNYSTDIQVITISDNTKPIITDQADITVNCGTSTLPSATGTPTATDNCSTPVITYSDANGNNKITRTWKATDAAGNYSTSTQIITIVDNVKPTITVPSNVTISCSGSTNPSSTGGSATGADACSSVSISYSDVTIGSVITRTWKATDASGNFVTANQTITLADNTKPVISDVNDITISCGSSTTPTGCGSVATATDNCSTPVVTYSDVTSGNKITRTWQARDAAGNIATSTQIITIVDNTKPVISDVSDVTVNCNASTLPSATGTATATDACSTPVITYGDVTSGNKIIRTWRATDAAGNYSTSTQTITIGSAFTATISSDPTGNTYTGGNNNNLYIGYGAQSTVLEVCSLPSSGAPYTYAWSGSYTNKLNNTNTAAPTFTPSTFGYYTFSVTVTNKFGCTSTSSISICVTDIRVAGTSGSGAKVYMCHKPSGYNKPSQTIQVLVSQVASHLGSGSCGSDGNDRLGSCDQSPCNTTVVNAIVGTTLNATKESVETIATSEEELKVTVMPNPTTAYFTLKLESKYATPVNMRVMDGRGRVIDAKSKIGANSTIQIGHNYSSGTYYAELIQGNTRKVVQLIKGRG